MEQVEVRIPEWTEPHVTSTALVVIEDDYDDDALDMEFAFEGVALEEDLELLPGVGKFALEKLQIFGMLHQDCRRSNNHPYRNDTYQRSGYHF